MRRQHMGFLVVAVVAATVVPAVPAQAAPRCFGRVATIVGTHGNDKLVGTRGPDVIVGRGGTDHIYGRGGRDRICGGAGEDRLYGGRGHDRIHAGRGDESGRGSWLFGQRGNDLLLGSRYGDGEQLFGGPGNDTLRALDSFEIYTDALYGGPGRDILTQGAGEAWLEPGRGDDEVDGGSREIGDGPGSPDRTRDHLDLSNAPGPLHVDLAAGTSSGQGSDRIANIEAVIGGAFDDRLIGGGSRTQLPQILYGMAGNDVLVGSDADDILFGEGAERWEKAMEPPFLGGEPGNDTLLGGRGDDLLKGSAGDDHYIGGRGEDAATFEDAPSAVTVDLGTGRASGEGNDELRWIENVYGGDFDDTLIGDEGDNLLNGRSGSNTLRGAGGNDTFPVFGSGTGVRGHVLEGGAGSDTVHYACNASLQSPFEVDLQTGVDTVGNSLAEIENVISNCRGAVHGDDGPNRLVGTGELNGRAGDDVIVGGSANDTLNGGDGNDVLDGGGGTDVCTEGETLVSCEA